MTTPSPKEIAHDDYLLALRVTEARFAAIRYDASYSPEYIRGWREALITLTRAIVQAAAARMDAEAPPSDLRD